MAKIPPMKPSRSEYLQAGRVRLHLRRWGDPDAPALVLLHGWLDTSATFQFLVDALRQEWSVVAPDWRGFGLSDWSGESYWYADYLPDLEVVLDHVSPDAPARIVGHSMGGNVATLYAGARPERIARLVNLEGLSPLPSYVRPVPERIRGWLEQKKTGLRKSAYRNREELAARLMRANPRLSADKAAFLALHLGIEAEDGSILTAADAWQRGVTPLPVHREQIRECWQAITAPVLLLAGAESEILKEFADRQEEYRERLSWLRDCREVVLADAGHNMHHDRPEAVAELVEGFFTETR